MSGYSVASREDDPVHTVRAIGRMAQILIELGVRNMTLLTNTKRSIVGLNGYGINLVAQQPIPE